MDERQREYYRKYYRKYNKKEGSKNYNSYEYVNSYGFYSMPHNEVIDNGGFKDAFVDTLIAMGHNHISAVMVLHTWLHGFDGYRYKKEIDNE